MTSNILGYPRIGVQRELKKACEAFWAGRIDHNELEKVGKALRKANWQLMQSLEVGLIPSNDFSFYDHVLDLTLSLGAIPERYARLRHDPTLLYFAMARGLQTPEVDVTAMEMTKWFDTNYHYIVPEFTSNQEFCLFSTKAANEYTEAKALGIETKPVIIGPITYLLLGKEKEHGFHRIDLLSRLLPAYIELLQSIEKAGAKVVQIDEPMLALDLDDRIREAYVHAYEQIRLNTKMEIILTTYFGTLSDNLTTAVNLPIDTLHIDVVRAPKDLDDVLTILPPDKKLSVGVVDGRNIWKNDFKASLTTIKKATDALGADRVLVATSCSLLHSPYDIDLETNDNSLNPQVKSWLAFAKQKVSEVVLLTRISEGDNSPETLAKLDKNCAEMHDKATSPIIHNADVAVRLASITPQDSHRMSNYKVRAKKQRAKMALPLFPTTTIGSFPQTTEVRTMRARHKKGQITTAQYHTFLRAEIGRWIKWQEEVDIDVLVHGEFERNDMVEYFGEKLSGFAFTQNGWVQSYGSRCVKPPIIFGDVSRPIPMTTEWSGYAQSLTSRPVKGMLTGPVTILQWSFVRNDQPRSTTCKQIALAICDEVKDLEAEGISIIQIDEPAIREGLPLRKAEYEAYLEWAVEAFRISAAVASDNVQIHTHMCYSEFNEMIEHIATMDADVITIECSRSQMELLDVFRSFSYPNEIGPGVYDIHSERVPSEDEIVSLLHKATELIPAERVWVNPDCGLKTRHVEETKSALTVLVAAAKKLRAEYGA